MARPSTPPATLHMSPPPSPPSTPPHSKLLNSYAAHMKNLSLALDSRAHALHTSEARLEGRGSALRAHERALAALERRMRSEMTAFLRDVAARQRQLSRWEQRAEKGRQFVNAISKNKKELHKTKLALDEKTTELQQLRTQHSILVDTSHNVRAEIESTRIELSRLADEAVRIAEEKTRLETLAQRLESLETGVRKREREIDAVEAAAAVKSQRLQWLESFERIIAPLQSFVDDFCALEERETLSIREDVPNAIHMALTALRETRSKMRLIKDRRTEVDALQFTLNERERAFREKEAALRQRERNLQTIEAKIADERDKISAQRAELKDGMRAVDDATLEYDKREETLQKKDTEFLQRDSKLNRRETAISNGENTLSRRERSIRRAHAAVGAREKALGTREREVENERANFTNLKRSLDLREAMLETRELELSTREASLADDSRMHPSGGVPLLRRRNSSFDRDLHSALQESNEEEIAPAPRPEKSANEMATNHLNDQTAPNPKQSQSLPPKQTAPQTVRRQLEFEYTRRRMPAAPEPEVLSRGQDSRDDESEAAAEQLLPELVGARALWKERIMRLETVVRTMRTNTFGLRPHVQPVLGAVADQLGSVRREIEGAPSEHSEGSAKSDYATEQGLQVRWGSIMRHQLDAVREVQTGMLIGLNKQDDIAKAGELSDESSTSSTLDRGSQRRSPGTVEDESSVDATLDVTMTGGLGGEDREEKQDGATIPSLFQRFRSRLQARGGLQQDGEIAGARDTRKTAAVINDRHAVDRSMVDANAGSNDLFQELASLRSELDTISGVLNI